MLFIARLLARDVIWLVPVGLVFGWLTRADTIRRKLLESALAGLFGVLIAGVLGSLWYHPRPFAMGLGTQFLPHAADASFPSDHLTLIWSVAFSLVLHPGLRRAGICLAVLGLPVAWARIYLGVHFPLDMVGAAIVSVASSSILFANQGWLMPPAFAWVSRLYRRLLAPLIVRGWIT